VLDLTNMTTNLIQIVAALYKLGEADRRLKRLRDQLSRLVDRISSTSRKRQLGESVLGLFDASQKLYATYYGIPATMISRYGTFDIAGETTAQTALRVARYSLFGTEPDRIIDAYDDLLKYFPLEAISLSLVEV